MKALAIEVTVLAILCVILLAILIPRLKEMLRFKNIATIGVVILALVVAYIVIHMFFCYQVGFPASVTQDPSADLTLSSADWLGFLGGYLGFAGSLVMAYLVYRQSDFINKFTISEYEPSAGLIIKNCVKSTEHDRYIDNNIVQSIPGAPEEHYYTIYYIPKEKLRGIEDGKHLVFVEIVNNSKLPISKISFSEIKIEELSVGGRGYEYKNSICNDVDLDPADGLAEILPGGKIRRCFVIDKPPRIINIGWITIRFSGFFLDRKHLFEAKVLVSKEAGHRMTLLRETNSFIVGD